MHSDHSYITTVVRLKAPKNILKRRKKTNWGKFMGISNRRIINRKLSDTLKNCADLGYEELCNYMKESTKEVTKEENNEN